MSARLGATRIFSASFPAREFQARPNTAAPCRSAVSRAGVHAAAAAVSGPSAARLRPAAFSSVRLPYRAARPKVLEKFYPC